MKRLSLLFLLGLAAACTQPAPPSVSVQIVQPGPLNLTVGQSRTLSATVSNTSNTAVTWSSSSPSVASVEPGTGAVLAVTAGQTTVTARSVADTTKSASITVNVTAPPVAVQITTPSPLALTVGQTQNLSATVSNTLNTAVTWSSSNPAVLSVNSSGRIQALTAGSSTITARSEADTTKSAALTVNVTTPGPNAGISVSLSPNTPFTLTQLGETRQVTATVAGTTNQGILWRITTSSGQTATLDTADVAWVSQSGLVTAVGQAGTVTVTAVSVADPSKTATVNVTLSPAVNAQTISGTISVPPINTQGLSLQSAQRLEGDYVPGEVIVRFRPSVSLQSVQGLSVNGVSLQQVRALGDTETFLFRAQVGDTSSLIQGLNSRPDVLWAEPNYRVYAQLTPNDPSFSDQWGLTQIRLPQAWDTTQGSAGVRIAVIDSGVVSGHPDLQGKLLSGYDFISDPQSSDDGDGRDTNPEDPNSSANWHGTHVAGIAAAATNNGVGVAGAGFNSRIVPIRALSGSGGTTADVLDAIRWASGATVAGVPANANPAQVINLSLGGQFRCSNAYQEALNDALGRGSIIVVAAGNSNVDASLFTPASCAGVITVGAVNRGGNKASYSNFGSRVDLAAPGGEPADGILSTVGGGSLYERRAGTSMAAPHVSGLIALMKARKDSLSAVEALSLLRSTGAAASGVGVLVNAEAAITRPELAPAPPPPPPTLSIGAAPARVSLRPDQSTSVTVNLTRGNFTGSVSISVSGLPSGVTGSFSPASTTGNSSTLTLTAGGTVPTATSTLTITASGGPADGTPDTATVQLDTEQPTALPPPAQVNLQGTVVYPCVVIEDRCIFVDTNPSQSTFTVTSPVTSANYSFRPVYQGSYVVYALKDVNGDGKANPGDFNAIYSVNNVVTPVAPGATNINLTLGPIVQRQEVGGSGLTPQRVFAR
ncbi:MAG: S8 family serine peptidase [Meiothermus sp.]|nr:S8 family serine peptidase [Meiothermus sp.]